MEKNLKMSDGVAYGTIDGYMVTLVDGWDIKKVSFHCNVTDEAKEILERILLDKDFKKQYRIGKVDIQRDYFSILFIDTIKTMKKVVACLETLPSILNKCSIESTDFCSCCCGDFEEDKEQRIVKLNDVVHITHGVCADMMLRHANMENKFSKKNRPVILGVLGAVLGCVVGALPLVLSYYFGWIFPLLSVFIGICAKLGYDLVGGKIGAKKIIAVFSISIIGSFGGMLASFVAKFIPKMAELNVTIMDILKLWAYSIKTLTPMGINFIIDFLLSALLAFLGAYFMLRYTHEKDKKSIFKVKILESAADVKEENKNEF